MMTTATPDTLNSVMEFDHVIRTDGLGNVEEVAGVYAPEVHHSETDDIQILGDRWEALTGYTGQYSYHGAVMHASEYIGGGLARDILEIPGTYVAVVVEVYPEDDDPEPEPAGWAVLRLLGGE